MKKPKQKSRCRWCDGPLPRPRRYAGDLDFCKKSCRQAAWRVRCRYRIDQENKRPRRCAIADPPYPGLAWRYKDQPSYKGEVDHVKLIASLRAHYDGWALCTGAYALRDLLPLCPAEARVCAWVKPHGVSSKTFGIHNAWEPVIVVPARHLRPGKRDWLLTPPARGGGDVWGRKPEAFCCWLFELLGMLPGDQLDDLFPGSGIVGRAWAEICRGTA